MLARLFIIEHQLPLDFARIADILLVHDLPEIECGDTPTIPGVANHIGKAERDAASAQSLCERLPRSYRTHFEACLAEYKRGDTPEAKFARAIDKLDADIHELGYPKNWAGWSEDAYSAKREPYYREVPCIYDFYTHLKTYLRENGYFDVPLLPQPPRES